MVKRTEYIITDNGVSPSQIMMVTFTNKAASEIKKRIAKISNEADQMWIGTFHSICVKLLRRFGAYLGITNFSILDQKDARKVLIKVLKKRGFDVDATVAKEWQAKISTWKNEVIRPSDVVLYGAEPYEQDVYTEYQNTLWRAKTFDFDDLIIYGILLCMKPEVSQWLRENIKFLMVDEMQDSNTAQFKLINLIIQDNNVFLVGDVNQSIYGFRNARPELLNEFVNKHPNTIQLKLEQNYRSTKRIISAANKVVAHNSFGTKLEMFCDNAVGDKIKIHKSERQYDEAPWVINEIMIDKDMHGKEYSDYAIIYRANYQSRLIEDELASEGIPYVVFGGVSFYSRKETRDLLAFCKVYANQNDMEALRRVLSTATGVGKQTQENILSITVGYSAVEAINSFINNPMNRITAKALTSLKNIATVLSGTYSSCSEIVNAVIMKTDYRRKFVGLMNDDAVESIGIIDEVAEMISSMDKDSNRTIMETIDEISLLSDAKGEDKSKQNAVKLMTAHASKGLEFDTVFVIGCEEGCFPHKNAIESPNPKDSIEEERRLFYVAMTRAEKKLYISSSKSKFSRDSGTTRLNQSRFIDEIPEDNREDVF